VSDFYIEEEGDWNDMDDDFWEQLAEDMSEEGYNNRTGEYHWIEFSHYKYDIPTKWEYSIDTEEEKEVIKIKKGKHGGFLG